jgi:hypothetical protein
MSERMTRQVSGDVWAVPPMPRDRWMLQPPEVWRAVEREISPRWRFKLVDARRLAHGDYGAKAWNYTVAVLADDLGVPVGQMFTACLLRLRRG